VVEKLENYISDLLWKHDCVVVPGFGGFVLNEQPAHFESNSHELLPPGKRITFNRSLSNNDGLLHHYIAQVTGQSFESAQSFVTAQINYWKLQLLSKEPLKLVNLGTLNADVEGRWIFTPADVTYTKAAFGLESLQLWPLETAPAIRIQPPKKDKAVPVKAGRRKVWVRRTATVVSVICLLAVAGYFLIPQLDNMPELASFSFWEKTPDVKPSVIPEKNEEPAPVITDSITPPDINTPTEVPVLDYKFYIIGGSFLKEKNAVRFKSELEQKGYAAEVLHNENGFFRVAYINNPDSLAASRELQKIKTEENQAAWLLKW
jgi:hypothetical protein